MAVENEMQTVESEAELSTGPAKGVDQSKVPHSLKEATEFAIQRIEALTDSFNSQYHQAMREVDTLEEMRMAISETMIETRAQLDMAWDVLKNMGAKQTDERRNELRLRGYKRLFEDFSSVRSFARTTPERLKQTALETHERTDFETRKIIIDYITASKFGPYLMKHFKDDVHTLLDEPFNATLQAAFKQKVLEHFHSDDDINPSDRKMADHSIESLIDTLEDFENMKGNSHLSIASLHAMFGRVPSEEEMAQIFEKNYEAIAKIPVGNIRIVMPDTAVDFYHEQGVPLPKEVLEMLNQDPNARVVHVHYRADSDMVTLFADMSKDEFLTGKTCDDGKCVEIEGRTDSPDFDILHAPDSLLKKLRTAITVTDESEDEINALLKKEFLKAPMKYLSHDIVFSAKRNEEAMS